MNFIAGRSLVAMACIKDIILQWLYDINVMNISYYKHFASWCVCLLRCHALRFPIFLQLECPSGTPSWCISLRRKYFPIPIVRLFFPAVAASRCYSTDYWVTTVTSVSSRISQSGKDRQPNRSPTTVLGSQLFESRVIPELLRLAGAIDAVAPWHESVHRQH